MEITGTWQSTFGNHDKCLIEPTGDGSFLMTVCPNTEYEKTTVVRNQDGIIAGESLWGPLVFTFLGNGLAMENGDQAKMWKLQDERVELLARCGDLWELMPDTDIVDLTPVQNTGAVHTEEDLERSRRMCIESGCGGFVVRGGDFNAKGEETDPPRGFLFRALQADLRTRAGAARPHPHAKGQAPVLWLAPPDFEPDVGFRIGRDPAPAMHIWWEQPQGACVQAFACRVCVGAPTEMTYYMVCGFHCGYCGIQLHDSGKKQMLFSVWDHPNCTKCESLHCGEAAQANRFGGEGCGAGNYVTNGDATYADWVPGTCYTFCVRALSRDQETVFACDVFTPEDGAWHRLGVVRRPQPTPGEGAAPSPLRGLYSFIEEFGGPVGTRKAALFGPAWLLCEGSANWESVLHVKTTSTVHHETLPNQRASAAADGCRILLETGGEAFDQPGPYKGPVAAAPVPAELANLLEWDIWSSVRENLLADPVRQHPGEARL